MLRIYDRVGIRIRFGVSLLVLFALCAAADRAARATTVLFVDGTFATVADQFTLNFALPDYSPFADANMKFQTYQFAGGAPSPGITVSPGGTDSVLTLSGPWGISANDDYASPNRDSEIRTSGFSGDAGATIIPPLLGGNQQLVLRSFGSMQFGNGKFALNALSTTGALFVDQGFSVTGLTGTAGTSLNRVILGATSASVPPKLISDSAGDSLVANLLQFYGNYEFNLTDGLVFLTEFDDGARNAVYGGGGAGKTNISGGTFYAQSQYWAGDKNHASEVNHSGGTNSNSALLSIGYGVGSNGTYKLSGTGVVDTDSLQIGTLITGIGTAQFLQSGGTAHADVAIIGTDNTSFESALYRLTGGEATLDSLSLIFGGVFELSGGKLITSAVSKIDVSGGGQFNWFSGTLQLNSFTLDGGAGILGPTLTLGPGKTLEVLGETTNNTVLTLAGGRLITDTIAGPGALVLDAGELRINSASGLNIDASGPLGANPIVKSGVFLNVPAGIVVQPGSTLAVQDGGRVSTLALNVLPDGLLQLGGTTARVEGVAMFNNGVVTGSGIIGHLLANVSGGEVSVSVGQSLRFVNASAAHENQGLLRLAGGELLFTSTLSNEAAGRIEGRGVLRTGGLTNQAYIAFSGGITDVYGDVANNTASISKGITISGNSDVTFWDDVNNVAGSLFRVSAGSSATFFGAFGGAGVSGPGSVYLEADVTPGASPAIAAFGGNVSLGPAARLVIELGGTTVGTQYDQLSAAGLLTLGGKLSVALLGPFMPAPGNTFDILNWGSLSGTFDTVELPTLAGGRKWNTDQLYTSGVLLVISGVLGDYNNDGTVNAADYTVYRNRKAGIGGTTLLNDDTPGVAFDDYVRWKTRYGSTSGSGSSASTGAAHVPEPATLVLACLACLAASVAHRRRDVDGER